MSDVMNLLNSVVTANRIQLGQKVTISPDCPHAAEWPGEFIVVGIEYDAKRKPGELNITIISEAELNAGYGTTDGWTERDLIPVPPPRQSELQDIFERIGFALSDQDHPDSYGDALKQAEADLRLIINARPIPDLTNSIRDRIKKIDVLLHDKDADRAHGEIHDLAHEFEQIISLYVAGNDRLQRHGRELFSTAKALGWKDDGESPLNFIARHERKQGMKGDVSTGAIGRELYIAAEALGASPDLLAIIGSYGDTLTNSDVLDSLKLYNKTGKCLIEKSDMN